MRVWEVEGHGETGRSVQHRSAQRLIKEQDGVKYRSIQYAALREEVNSKALSVSLRCRCPVVDLSG